MVFSESSRPEAMIRGEEVLVDMDELNYYFVERIHIG
jgi:hypothetical protein